MQNLFPLFSFNITRSHLRIFWEINSSSYIWVFFIFISSFISVLGIRIAQLIIKKPWRVICMCQWSTWSTLSHNCLAYYLTGYEWNQNQFNFSQIIYFDIIRTTVDFRNPNTKLCDSEHHHDVASKNSNLLI